MSQIQEILEILKSHSSEESRKGMARYGINTETAFGTGIPLLRGLAKRFGKNHELALSLWKSGFHEARILASMIDNPKEVTEQQMDDWASKFNSWDICDQCIMNLFEDVPIAWGKVNEWCNNEEEFVKRAGFVLIARFGVSDKKAGDESFIQYFSLIYKHSDDNRPMVKKAVNWAVRQIGKRNLKLNKEAITLADKIYLKDSTAAKWIATDALKELKSDAVQKRLKMQKKF